MGGNADTLSTILRAHEVLLAAHGPYTAAGVAETLGLPVECVSKDFSSFDGGQVPFCDVLLTEAMARCNGDVRAPSLSVDCVSDEPFFDEKVQAHV